MGILDDAIREHLDLKRRQGAEEDELARLEGEAFGPPTRPGDPDFPEQPPTGESASVEPSDPASEADAGPATTGAPFDLASEAPAEPVETTVPEATIEDAVEVPPEPPHAVEPEPAPPEPEPEIPTDEELPDAAVPLARELRAIVDPPDASGTGAAEVDPDDELDLDLDLELDEPEPAATADPTPTPAREQPPAESFDTVEHHFEGAIEETGDIEVVEGEVAEEPLTGEDDRVAGEDEAEDDEDVLEETPEFLRDQPEDDELWFEQGSPKDFDF